VDAALVVLKSMGLSLEDLAAPGQRPDVPTFADYIPVVSATVTDGTRKPYGSYARGSAWVSSPGRTGTFPERGCGSGRSG
jgi:hypothetical protein